MADLDAVAILERHSQVLLFQPVVGGDAESLRGQGQRHHRPGEPEIEALAHELDCAVLPAKDVETIHESGKSLIELMRILAGLIEPGIHIRIEGQHEPSDTLGKG